MRLSSISAIIFITIFYLVVDKGGWKMLILQFFGWFVVSLLASIGVLQTPGPEGLAFRRHLTVSPVTINRRLSDAQR